MISQKRKKLRKGSVKIGLMLSLLLALSIASIVTNPVIGETSHITIKANGKDSVVVEKGASVVLDGNITDSGVTFSNQTVTIWNSTDSVVFANLTAVKTSLSSSRYSYSWVATNVGTFFFKANWTGGTILGTTYDAAESSIVRVTVKLAKIEIVPSKLTIGRIGGKLPTELVTMNVTVKNVTDLYAWQIKVYFDQSILEFENITAASIPYTIDPYTGNIVVNDTSNIFWNKTIFPMSAVVLQDRNTGNRYVQFGTTLMYTLEETEAGLARGINGSGVLCQLNFKGVSTGNSYLNFAGGEDTYLLNSTETFGGFGGNLMVIPSEVVNAEVDVLGEGISINVSPDVLEVGEEASITGVIFPQQENIDVTISSRLNGTDTWSQLGTVQTFKVPINDTYWEAHFSFIWKPDKDGLYELKAEGGGFVSRVKQVTVKPGFAGQQIGMELYASVGAVLGVGAVGFFVWDRRRRRSGRIIMP